MQQRQCLGAFWFAALALSAGVARAADATFVDVARVPDSVHVDTDADAIDLVAGNGGAWAGHDVRVTTTTATSDHTLRVKLQSATAPVKHVVLHWNGKLDEAARCLPDAWERAYGDLQWKPLDGKRPMPWYFLATAGDHTDGYGVMTGPNAMCCWKADADGLTLTADVRSGGVGVQLGSRTLDVCTVLDRAGHAGESAFDADVALCKLMCPHPRLPKQPVYGFNDWYCTYGHNTAEGFVKDAATLAALAPAGENRPFMVIDDGWQAGRQGTNVSDNPWDRTNDKFGSTMPDVASRVKGMKARPGLWYRPLELWASAPPAWRLRGKKDVADPTIPAVKAEIAANMRRFHAWGYDLVKHDFSTSEISGKWGREMGDQFTPDGWSFADRTRTTAEVILDLYHTIRQAGGDGMVIDGCNTVSHLSAGIFELQRVGDDTSGNNFGITKSNGVNCLAFRAPQNGTFYLIDADCVGLAQAGKIPWEKNRQFLDLLARSGTPLIVSWKTDLLGPEQADAIRAAFAEAAKPQPLGQPLDWMQTRVPKRWMLDGNEVTFTW